ncbi:MAG: FkbM family methyltransferase [Bacteroidales bacterium]|nr:FkbM family methyltransferase [Bacteroidales bacterium]
MNILEKTLQSKKVDRFRRYLGKSTGIYLKLKRFTPSTSEALRTATILNNLNIKYVFDIGANTGQFAESLFDFNYKGTVISFEPVTSCYNTLLERSRKYPNMIVHEKCAIGDDDQLIDINVTDDSVFSSILKIKDFHARLKPKSKIVKQETVNMFRLDSIIDKYIDDKETSILLKIDTQGFEKEVLDGAKNSLKRIQGIKIEIPLVSIYENTKFTFYKIIDFLKQHNFSPYSFNIEGVNLKTGRVHTIDGLFIRESNQ